MNRASAAASVSALSDPAYSRIASVTVGRNNEQVGVSGPKVTMEAGSGGTVALGGGTVGFSINGNEISYAAVNPVFSGTPTVSGDEIFSAAPTFDAETGILSYSLSGSAQNGQKAVVDVTASSAFYSGVSYVPVTITVGKATAVTASGKLTMWSDSAALILLYPGSATDEEIMFRGLFLRKLEPFVGALLANCLIALVFTGLHAVVTYTSDQIGFLAATLPLAVAWGYIMQKTDALWGSILFHAGMDIPIVLGLFSVAS